MSEGDTLKPKLIDCLSQQTMEFEVLKSMYPNDGEVVLSDAKVLENMESFIYEQSDCVPNNLDFVLNLNLINLKIEFFINLPSFYPEEEPDICIRCNQLNRQQETLLNNELSNYIKNNFIGEPFLYSAINWLQDNIDSLTEEIRNEIKPAGKEKKIMQTENFARYWIYSHHIYNKRKKEEIISKARELNLGGFSLPGKPGIVCIEGFESHCQDWWKHIKSMCWKKIVIKKMELFDISEQLKEKRFDKFEEVFFPNAGASKNCKHADMSSLFKYVEKFDLTPVLNDFFGLCND